MSKSKYPADVKLTASAWTAWQAAETSEGWFWEKEMLKQKRSIRTKPLPQSPSTFKNKIIYFYVICFQQTNDLSKSFLFERNECVPTNQSNFQTMETVYFVDYIIKYPICLPSIHLLQLLQYVLAPLMLKYPRVETPWALSSSQFEKVNFEAIFESLFWTKY